MINRYLALFCGLGILVGGYTIWWQNEADHLKTAFPQALAKSLPPGAALRQRSAGVGGYPFRFNVQLADVKVTWGTDWASTPAVTGIFQPFAGDHLILHLDAPVDFGIEGATGRINAERALASLVGYESGQYQLDLDAMNVTLEQPAVARLHAARMQLHVRREVIGPPAEHAVAVSARGITPKEAATGRLAGLVARYGEAQQDGTVNLNIDEKGDLAHAGGKTLSPDEAEALQQAF
ncbi:DUF2125 domain-containing protein [Emcibacter sp. SYSU 3D8]|uniref:DUF2125 domain-containing protein n=1 Tax=Emcibacter sp. SYSU 3D8 TaxID=3133969 RepID=UPI0031FE9D0C